MSERNLKINRTDFLEIKKMHSDIIGNIGENILFRWGYIKGKSIIKKCGFPIDINDRIQILKFEKEFLKKIEEIMKQESLLNNAILTKNIAKIYGGIEVEFCNKPSCHFMRGILSKIYEIYHGERVVCREVECEGVNNKYCVFNIDLSI